MMYALVIVLAVAAFAVAVFAFRLPRRAWTTVAAALALGLAGYAWQGHPELPGAPGVARTTDPELGSALIESRKAMVKEEARSPNPNVITADAYARHGRYDTAASFLTGAVEDNPRDAEAWLALGNALVEHAGGALTPPALLAYRRAQEADPKSAGPGYFLGLAMIRGGRMEEASQVWRATLASAAPDAAGRAQLEVLLQRLNAALAAHAGQSRAGN